MTEKEPKKIISLKLPKKPIKLGFNVEGPRFYPYPNPNNFFFMPPDRHGYPLISREGLNLTVEKVRALIEALESQGLGPQLETE